MSLLPTEMIEGLEDETWKVLSTNGAGLLPYLSEDCRMLFPFGMTISNSSDPDIKEIMTSEAFIPWIQHTMSEVVVTPLGADSALISYRVKAVRPDTKGQHNTYQALVSSVWRRDKGTDKWLMCFHQQSPYVQPIEELVQ